MKCLRVEMESRLYCSCLISRDSVWRDRRKLGSTAKLDWTSLHLRDLIAQMIPPNMLCASSPSVRVRSSNIRSATRIHRQATCLTTMHLNTFSPTSFSQLVFYPPFPFLLARFAYTETGNNSTYAQLLGIPVGTKKNSQKSCGTPCHQSQATN